MFSRKVNCFKSNFLFILSAFQLIFFFCDFIVWQNDSTGSDNDATIQSGAVSALQQIADKVTNKEPVPETVNVGESSVSTTSIMAAGAMRYSLRQQGNPEDMTTLPYQKTPFICEYPRNCHYKPDDNGAKHRFRYHMDLTLKMVIIQKLAGFSCIC